jgi:hypothetical protein
MKPNMLLVGRVSRNYLIHKTLTNQEKAFAVEEYVKQYFWSGGIYFHNQDQLLNEMHPYPEFFAAGWFAKQDGADVKQTVIVAHGNSLVDAKSNMLNQAAKVQW